MTRIENSITMGHDNVGTGKDAMAPDAMVMAGSETGSTDYYIDPVKERKMMRKFDVSHLRSGIQAMKTDDSCSFTQSLLWVSCT
jgi:hypothetical protein